jgi:predicted CxxxxCH...CXXCH cytochrome family protein
MPGSSLEVVPSQGNLQYNGQDVNFTYTYNAPAGGSTCSNITCHSMNLNNPTGGTLNWDDNPGTCNGCHGYPPTSGRHSSHMNSARQINGSNINCSSCHGTGADTGSQTGHVNGSTDVVLASGGTFTSTGTGTGTCSGACHAGQQADWTTTATIGCKDCHDAGSRASVSNMDVASSFMDYTTFETSVHADAKGDRTLSDDTDCQVCHTDATYAAMTAASDYEATGNSNTKTCNNCHGGA